MSGLLKALFGKGWMFSRTVVFAPARAFRRPPRGRVVAETDRTKWRPNQAPIMGPKENED